MARNYGRKKALNSDLIRAFLRPAQKVVRPSKQKVLERLAFGWIRVGHNEYSYICGGLYKGSGCRFITPAVSSVASAGNWAR